MPLIDMHCDTLTALLRDASLGDLMENKLSVDLKRLQSHDAAIEFFATFIYLDAFKDRNPDEAWDFAMKVLDYFDENASRYPDDVMKIQSYEDVRSCLLMNGGKEIGKCAGALPTDSDKDTKKRVGALLTIEEGGILNNSMERLETLYDRGVRLITLTWNFENCLAFPNSSNSDENSRGLKAFGFEAIERMSELGMIVDVSHLSDGGFYDVAKTLKKPFVASHSNARAVCNHQRNLTDDMLVRLAQCGGAAGLNLCPAFLDEKNGCTIEAMTAHILHILRVAGEDTPAIGTDFDGIHGELEIPDTSQLGKLWESLQKRGVSERILDKIMYQNAMRVLKEVL